MSTSSQEASLGLLSEASGVGPSTLEDFKTAGFESAEEVGSRTPEELSDEVNGVGFSTAVSVLNYLEKQGLRDTSRRDRDLEKLVELLQELFEFENKDRDFGIYKLMNENRKEIEEYIENELTGKIEEEVQRLHDQFGSKTRDEVRDDVIDELGGDALDGDSLSEEARQLIEERASGISQDELENARSEIYNAIYQFFSNYYEDGDFITRRKRSHHNEPYSIPYDGSNTNFHWVTKDQYYAKTSDIHSKFIFNHNQYEYRFILTDGEIYETGSGSEYFIMKPTKNIEVDSEEKTITIPFVRQSVDDEDLLERCNISQNNRNSFQNTFINELVEFLDSKGIRFSKEDIESKMDEYMQKNQSDFFIHKDINGFLTRELEEYIKTEIVTFDPKTGLDGMTDLSVEKGRIVNEISTDIIEFVSQLEEFKRKLFEKKKFVTDKKQLAQVSEINEDYHSTVLSNDTQLSYWEETYGIDTSELTVEDLSDAPYNQMVVDTQYFEEDITTGEEPRNKLIKGDNYQALNFLEEKYKNSVKCIYIDPPYNTGNANFAYKDKYQRPTWLSMMHDRLETSRRILSDDGLIFISIDRNEIKNIRNLGDNIFGEENHIGTFIWKKRAGGRGGKKININHEYIVCYAKDENKSEPIETRKSETKIKSSYPHKDEQGRFKKRPLRKSGQADEKKDRPTMYYGIEAPDGTTVYPIKPDGSDGRWSRGQKSVEELRQKENLHFEEQNNSWKVYRKERPYDMQGEVKKEKYTTILNDVPLTEQGGKDLSNVIKGSDSNFDFPKPVNLVEHFIKSITKDGDIVLDFFAGSGTTGQAVQELNRERDETVNYVLVEMLDEAFDITEERAKRIVFSSEWKDGEPQVDEIENELEFSAECIELESYEDALDAIEFDSNQQSLGSFDPTKLQYTLEFGTKDSPVFLDTDQLERPLEYKLSKDIDDTSVDVMTTFNYLLGLVDIQKREKEINGNKYTIYEGSIEGDDVLVVWRHNASKIGTSEYESEVENIDSSAYDKIYVNGDSMFEESVPISKVFVQKMLTEGDSL